MRAHIALALLLVGGVALAGSPAIIISPPPSLPLAGGTLSGNITSSAKIKTTLTPAAVSSNTDVTGFRTAGLDVTVNTTSIYTPMAHFENAGVTTSSVDVYANPNTYSPSIVLNNSSGNAELRSTGNTLQVVISAGVSATFSASTVTSPALVASSTLTTPLHRTTTNCTDSAGAAACTAAPAGSVVIDAAATTVTVSTTAVTANSQVFVMEDSSLETRLGLGAGGCNSTYARTYYVSARTAGTSFQITSSAAPITKPACLSYFIVN